MRNTYIVMRHANWQNCIRLYMTEITFTPCSILFIYYIIISQKKKNREPKTTNIFDNSDNLNNRLFVI
jgi:hypothetical protein